MLEIKIAALVLFISEYTAAYRLKNSKFFYIFLILAASDPITYLLGHLFHSNTIWWYVFQTSIILLILTIPGIKLRYKIAIALLVSFYPLLDTSKNAINIEMIIISALVIFVVIENLIKEILNEKEISVYYILIIIYFTLVGVSAYLYYTNYNFYLISHLFKMIGFIIISLLMAIVGPNYSIRFESKFLGKIFENYYKTDNITNNIADRFILLNEIEKQVLILIANGFSSKEIAEKIPRSKKSVDRYRSEIRNKLGIKSADQLKTAASAFARTYRENNIDTLTDQ